MTRLCHAATAATASGLTCAAVLLAAGSASAAGPCNGGASLGVSASPASMTVSGCVNGGSMLPLLMARPGGEMNVLLTMSLMQQPR